MKQNQVIAIVKGKKSQAERTKIKTYQILERSDLFSGIDRTYRPKNEDGDRKPPEKKIVQMTVEKCIQAVKESNEDMMNLVATMDIGNTEAKANVVIGETVLLEDVPATHLIYLEKRIEDLISFISQLSILDVAEEWSWNENIGCYSAKPRETTSTSKTLQHKVIAEATEHHPAQTVQYSIDEIVGYWTTISLSGNMAADDKKGLLERAQRLSDAVKIAREEANSIEVKKSEIGSLVLSYLFD